MRLAVEDARPVLHDRERLSPGDTTRAVWREIGPLLFASEDGRRKIGFLQDSIGTVVAVSAGAWRVLERVPPRPVGVRKR